MPQEQPQYVEGPKRNKAIYPSAEFKKKRLCTHTLDIGTICDHGCAYCSTPAGEAARIKITKDKYGYTAQDAHHKHIAHVSSDTPDKVKAEAGKLTKDDTVMLCAKVDPYSPAIQELNLFQDSLRNLLESNSECHVRILSKNAKIVDVMEEFLPYADRISFSLSITAPQSKAEFSTIVEPNASSIPERFDGLRRAKEMGFTIYGMICPCCPEILTDKADLKSVLDEILPLDPEAIWFEPVNGRGGGLEKTEGILAAAGKKDWSKAIRSIRKDEKHDQYVAHFIDTVHELCAQESVDIPIRMLIYNQIYRLVERDDSVIWLNSYAPRPC